MALLTWFPSGSASGRPSGLHGSLHRFRGSISGRVGSPGGDRDGRQGAGCRAQTESACRPGTGLTSRPQPDPTPRLTPLADPVGPALPGLLAGRGQMMHADSVDWNSTSEFLYYLFRPATGNWQRGFLDDATKSFSSPSKQAPFATAAWRPPSSLRNGPRVSALGIGMVAMALVGSFVLVAVNLYSNHLYFVLSPCYCYAVTATPAAGGVVAVAAWAFRAPPHTPGVGATRRPFGREHPDLTVLRRDQPRRGQPRRGRSASPGCAGTADLDALVVLAS